MSDGATINLAIALEDERWDCLPGDPERFVFEVLNHAGRHLELEGSPPTEVSVTLTDDASVREINREWRDKDKPTNVLSFPMMDLRPGDRPGPLLGDLVLAFETCEREASEEGKPFADHARHLLVHGFLHCLGYDHVEDDEAEAMEATERVILAGLGVPDPYEIAQAREPGDIRTD